MDKIADSILKFLKLDSLIGHVTGYVEARMDLLKMEIREDIAKAIASAVVAVALSFVGLLSFLFFSVGLAHFANSYFDQPYAGFWSVAGLYGFLFLILLLFRKPLAGYLEKQFSELIKRKPK